MLSEIMLELEQLGTEQTKKTYMNYGGKEPIFGVRVGDLNKLIKKYKIKNNQQLAIELFDTGNYDAMYLAGLIANSKEITKDTINLWIKKAYCSMIGDYAVGAVASETPFALEIAREFMQSDNEITQSCGYMIIYFYVAYEKDEMIDKIELENLLDYIEREIHSSKNRVKSAMNSTVISIGTSVPSLYEKACEVANKIGVVSVDVGKTSCKTPLAIEYLEKAKKSNRIGFKRKSSRC